MAKNIFASFLDDPDSLPKQKKGITGDGGINGSNEPDQEDYESLQDKKLKAETRKIDIANELSMRNLVERPMVRSFFAAIEQSIKTNFINMGRIISPDMAALLKSPEKEREINKFLDEKIGVALENVIKTIEKMNSDKMFD